MNHNLMRFLSVVFIVANTGAVVVVNGDFEKVMCVLGAAVWGGVYELSGMAKKLEERLS